MNIEDRVAALEREIAYIRGVVEQMDRRVAAVESRLNNIETMIGKLNRRFDEINKRFDSMFKWVIGLLTGLWAMVLLTMIPILLRLIGLI